LLHLTGGLLAAILLYVAAGFGLGAVATSDPPAAGPVQLAVVANPFHSDLVFPVEGAGIDWRRRLALPAEARFVAIGWGDRRFYLRTRHLGDLQLSTALIAISGLDDALLHVTWLDAFPDGPDAHVLPVTERQAEILAAYVDRFFVAGADGKPTALVDQAYGPTDAFFPASGHWSPFTTCNEWLARALRAAGIRTGVWAPFVTGVVRHL
jgi:uncharacterized protein (TIGR02117 family)